MIVFFVNYELTSVGLKYWTDDAASENPSRPFGYYIGIYALLQICGLVSLLLLAITLWVFAIKRAGTNLHQNALQTVLRAPLRFFAKTDTGVITNLFSQDLNLVDTELPEATLNTIFCVSCLLLRTMGVCPRSIFEGNQLGLTQVAGFSSDRASSCHAYIFILPSDSLSVHWSSVICRRQVLPANFKAAKTFGP